MDHLDRKNLKNVAFDVVLRGYDKRQVDERLRTLGAELAAAENALQAAAERVTLLADEVNRSRSGGDPQPESNFGARVEKILLLAEEEAREVRSQADAAAEQTRKAVAQEADELFTAAAQDADEVCKAARAEAEQLVAQARAEANRLVITATENAQQRERASAHELHQLARLHDEINVDLYRAKEVLDGLFGNTRPITRATPATTTGASPAAAKRPEDGTPDRHQDRTV